MLELVSKNVDNEEQAVRLLGLPVLASVPQPDSIRHNGQAGANVELPYGFGGESFRLLRHNLALNRPGWRSFQVTSAVAGEGKSFIAANLAITCAQQGSKVVLVDANLHRPSQHTRFQVPNASGLSDLLLNRALHSNKFIQPTQIENLAVLPAGSMATGMSIEVEGMAPVYALTVIDG